MQQASKKRKSTDRGDPRLGHAYVLGLLIQTQSLQSHYLEETLKRVEHAIQRTTQPIDFEARPNLVHALVTAVEQNNLVVNLCPQVTRLFRLMLTKMENPNVVERHSVLSRILGLQCQTTTQEALRYELLYTLLQYANRGIMNVDELKHHAGGSSVMPLLDAAIAIAEEYRPCVDDIMQTLLSRDEYRVVSEYVFGPSKPSNTEIMVDAWANMLKPTCKYGERCYRKNPQHLHDWYHPAQGSDAAYALQVDHELNNVLENC
jgi:hypothetical protein